MESKLNSLSNILVNVFGTMIVQLKFSCGWCRLYIKVIFTASGLNYFMHFPSFSLSCFLSELIHQSTSFEMQKLHTLLRFTVSGNFYSDKLAIHCLDLFTENRLISGSKE